MGLGRFFIERGELLDPVEHGRGIDGNPALGQEFGHIGVG